MLQATRSVPIVFVIVPDPVGAGFVDSLARPGGNATGFTSFEYGLSAKWLELLKEIAPAVTRAGVIRDPALASGPAQFAAIQSMAPSLGVEVSPINMRDISETERAVAAFARAASSGLVVTGSALVAVHRHRIIALAARHKLPAVYPEGSYVRDGGLMYGELFKMMAGVDMLHVPYRGGAPALTDLLAGQVQVMFDTLITSIEHIRAGKLRPLAVTAATRVEVLPDIPTVGEFVPGYEAVGWQGVGAPRTTPVEIIDKLNKEINAGLADPRIKARIADLGYTVLASSPADFGRFITAYTEKWAKVIKFSGAKIY